MTGELVQTFEGHTGRVISAAFSPDGSRVVTTSWDRTARVWLVSIEDLLKLAESLIQREPPTFTPEERVRFGIE
jgi:WD40 repeat protein